MTSAAGTVGPYSYFPSNDCRNTDIDAGTWSASTVRDVADGTARTGNHVCRPDVCYKGRIGRKGFCRMYFWHWCRFKDAKDKDAAKMVHGLALQPRWDGTGCPPVCASPPFAGLPAIETNQPFHFKMSPSMMMGPKCNHDIGILLRMGDISCLRSDSAGSSEAQAKASNEAARAAMV